MIIVYILIAWLVIGLIVGIAFGKYIKHVREQYYPEVDSRELGE